MCELYTDGENFGYSINLKHPDGTLGKLNPKSGQVIWSDGHSDKFDLLTGFHIELIGAYITAYLNREKAS